MLALGSGGAGSIGSWIVTALVVVGYAVHVLDAPLSAAQRAASPTPGEVVHGEGRYA
ncbi:hypothetical protein ACFC0M_21980 [Streptomyces sp. NPDC056149]|uniref:hypothetical protein n=1 Tax=unclassified Streptomyces TaxID=2593676 RepID=UPI002380F590|nr:hypothetical protein [Streptomyces sp. WZ-12]